MMDKYVAVIQAGGYGLRMREITQDKIPKPMILLNGKPMLQWQIEELVNNGIVNIIVIIGHMGEIIKEYFGDGSQLGASISYVQENEPLGSAGAFFYLKNCVSTEGFLLIFGDIMFQFDLKKMISFHEEHEATATLLAHPNAHPFDSDLLLTDAKGKVQGIDSKHNVRTYWYQNLVNAGLYVFDSSVLNMFEAVRKQDLEQDVLCPLIEQGKVYAYATSEYAKDAGTPERYWKVQEEQKNGIWEKKCLKNKQKCIFLDRDGTINKYCGLLSEIEEFELEEHVVEAVKRINESGYLAIVVTNQPVVARGMCSTEDVENIHKKMQTLLGQYGAYVDDIVFCPHHPDKGYPEENPRYKIKCDCRKPGIGMIEQMEKKFNIDLSDSWMIGDSTVDVETGKRAGMHTVLLKTGQAGLDGKYNSKPDLISDNLLQAVEKII